MRVRGVAPVQVSHPPGPVFASFTPSWSCLCRFHTLLVLCVQVLHPPGPVFAGSTPSWSCLCRFYTLLVLSVQVLHPPGPVCAGFTPSWSCLCRFYTLLVLSLQVLHPLGPVFSGFTPSWSCQHCCLENHPSGTWLPMDWCWYRESFGFVDHFTKTGAGIVSHLVLLIISPRLVLAS